METASASTPHPADLPDTTRSVVIDLGALSPEAEHSREIPAIPDTFDVRGAFDLESVESLRAEQYTVYERAYQEALAAGDEEETARLKADQAIERTIDTYLTGFGLPGDTDAFTPYKDGLQGVSITAVPESEWYAKFADGSTTELGQSGRDKTRATFEELTNEPYYQVSDVATLEATPQTTAEILENEKAKLATLRDQLAGLSAKRQGRLWGSGGDDYKQLEAAYNAQVVVVGKLELAEKLADDDLDDAAKRIETVSYLFTEQNALRELSLEKIKGTALSKFIETMTSGNLAQRIAKGALLGIGAGTVGFAASAVIGAAGAGVIIGGAVAAGIGLAGKFARGFALGDAHSGRGMQQRTDAAFFTDPHSIEAASHDEHFERAQNFYSTAFEEDTKREQAKRVRSTVLGIGTVAVGGMLGMAAHAAIDGFIGGVGTPDTGATPPSGEVDSESETPSELDRDGNGIPDNQEGGIDEPGGTPDTDEPGTPEVPPTPEIEGGSFTVDAGGSYTGELIQFAEANGHQLTPEQSWELHTALVDKFGTDYIDIAGVDQDVYKMEGGAYNIGLSTPGQANWDPGVTEFIQGWMTERGQW